MPASGQTPPQKPPSADFCSFRDEGITIDRVSSRSEQGSPVDGNHEAPMVFDAFCLQGFPRTAGSSAARNVSVSSPPPAHRPSQWRADRNNYLSTRDNS